MAKKKGGKNKGAKTVDLSTFQESVPAPAPGPMSTRADQVEDLHFDRSILPSGPRAADLTDAPASNEGGKANEGGRDGGPDRGGRRRDDGEDRTVGDWRKAPKTTLTAPSDDHRYNDR